MSKFTGKWSIGKTLLTRITKQWTQEEFAENDEKESRLVFANFTSEDEGKNRTIIAQCYNKEDALFISRAPEMFKVLKELSSYDIYDFHNAHAVKDLLLRVKNLTKEIEG